MVEPATGVSGALGALSNVRPPNAGGDSGSLSGAAQELSSAARGMQMAQGQIAGQTMAINQMTIAGQQQTQQLSMMISQLNMSIAQLVSAMNASSGAARMASMAASQPPPAFMPPQAPMMAGVGSSLGAMGMGAAQVGGGLFAGAARGVGNFAGAMAAPFIAGSYASPQAGQLYGSVGNAGAARSFMMGTGFVDLSRSAQQRSNAAEVQRLSADRGAFKMGEIMLGAGAGLIGVGANQLGGHIAGGIGSAIGSRVLGGGIGGMVGGLAGGILGGGLVGAALMAPVNQVMDQVGAIRGTGEMMGRNAFRFNNANQSRPTFRERSSFGRDTLDMANQDLLFTNNDMQQMFSGAIENDLMRGVGNSQQARQRMRQLKESVKVIGQTLGTTIQESMQVMGDLQGIGVGPQGATRFLAGANVSGLTRQEALQGQMSFLNRFAGSGMQGQGLMGLAAQSQQIGQVAMRQGMLTAEQIAGAGGRAGVNQVYGQGMVSLMQGGLGQLNMAARMGAGSFGGVSGNPLAALGQAGGAATTSNIVSFAANRGSNMRQMLDDPSSQARILQQIGSIADQFKGMGKREDIMKLLLKQQGVEDPTVFMALAKSQPQALREQMQLQQRALADMQVAQASENFSVTGRIGRAASNSTMPIASQLSGGMAGLQDAMVNVTQDVNDAVMGINRVPTSSGDVTIENLRRLKDSGVDGARGAVVKAKPTKDQMTRAKNAVASKITQLTSPQRVGMFQYTEGIEQLNAATDPDEKRRIALSIINRASDGEASKDPALQKAYERALSDKFGVDFGQILSGTSGGLSKEEKKKLDAATDEARRIMTGMGVTAGAAGVGAGIGSALGTMIAPGVGTAFGAMAGGKIGQMIGGKSGASAEQLSQISKSKNVMDALAAAESGNIDEVNQRLGAAVESGEITTSMKDQIAELVTADPSAAKRMRQSLGTIGELGGIAGTSVAMDRTIGVMRSSLNAAGGAGKDIASSLSGGREGVREALSQLRELRTTNREEYQDLIAKMGGAGSVLANVADIQSGMTRKELLARGATEEDLKSVIGGANTITSEDQAQQLREAILVRSSAGDGMSIAGTRGGFTQAQTMEQVKLAEQIARTAETLRLIEQSLASQGLLKRPT